MNLGITGSRFGDWFFVTIVSGFCASLFIGTIIAFQSGAEIAVSQFFWSIVDPTWMPPGQGSIPIVGEHHFGDWQIFYGWALHNNPYLLSPLAFNALPPFYWLLLLVSGLGLKLSFLVMWAATLAITILCFLLGLKFLPLANRILIILVLLFFTTGMIWTFSRGSLQGLAIGLLLFSVFVYKKNKVVFAGMIFALACSIKPYLLLLLLWPLLEKKYKQVALFVGAFGLVCLISFYLMDGGFMATISGWITGNSHYSTKDGAYLMTKGVGIFSSCLYLIGIFGGKESVNTFLTTTPSWIFMIPGIMWLLGFIYIFVKNKISRWMQFILILAATQLVMPASQIYTMVFASFATVLFIRYLYVNKFNYISKIFPVHLSFAFALFATIVPLQFPLQINGFTVWNVGAFLSPLLWIICMVTVVGYTAFSKNEQLDPQKAPDLNLRFNNQVTFFNRAS